MKRTALMFVVFLAGFGACWAYRDAREPALSGDDPPYFAEGITLHQVNGSGESERVYSLRPHSVRVGDRMSRLRKPSDQSQLWAITFDNGRVWVFAEEKELAYEE